MPGKNVNLSSHKVSWNSRSKLLLPSALNKFTYICTHTHTHTHTHTQLECTLKKKEKKFKLYPGGLSAGMVDDVSVLLESSPFGIEFFVIHPLSSVVTISQEKLNPSTLRGVIHTFAPLP
jgi:hypothetical protein